MIHISAVNASEVYAACITSEHAAISVGSLDVKATPIKSLETVVNVREYGGEFVPRFNSGMLPGMEEVLNDPQRGREFYEAISRFDLPKGLREQFLAIISEMAKPLRRSSNPSGGSRWIDLSSSIYFVGDAFFLNRPTQASLSGWYNKAFPSKEVSVEGDDDPPQGSPTSDPSALGGLIEGLKEKTLDLLGRSRSDVPPRSSQRFILIGKEQWSVEIPGGGVRLRLGSPYYSLTDDGELGFFFQRHATVFEGLVEHYFLMRNCSSPEAQYYIGNPIKFLRGMNLPADEPSVPDETSAKPSKGLIRKPRTPVVARSQMESEILITSPGVSFKDIGGLKEGKAEMDRICQDIIHPDRARFFGRDPQEQKGYMLFARPGSGKTLLVKALATKMMDELGDRVRFYNVNYEKVSSMWHGKEAERTRQVFDLVSANEEKGLTTLLFFDEIHAIAEQYKEARHANEALIVLLTHLDGMTRYKNLVVIGATFKPKEVLDPGLIREGRLGTWVELKELNEEDRKEIFAIYTEKTRALASSSGNHEIFSDLDLDALAKASKGFNGCNISGVIKAAMRAKETQAKEAAGGGATDEQIFQAFSPILTGFLLQQIQSYDQNDRPKKEVGFKP